MFIFQRQINSGKYSIFTLESSDIWSVKVSSLFSPLFGWLRLKNSPEKRWIDLEEFLSKNLFFPKDVCHWIILHQVISRDFLKINRFLRVQRLIVLSLDVSPKCLWMFYDNIWYGNIYIWKIIQEKFEKQSKSVEINDNNNSDPNSSTGKEKNNVKQ